MSIRRSRWSQLPGHLVATSIGGSENGESGGVDGSPPNVDHGRRRQWHAAGLSGAGALETRWVLNGNAVPQGRMLTMVRRGVRARQGSDVRRIHGTSFCFRRVFRRLMRSGAQAVPPGFVPFLHQCTPPTGVCKSGPDRPILRPASLTGATPTTTTRSGLPSAPGIGPAIPPHRRKPDRS
jgi:hypothetical protein